METFLLFMNTDVILIRTDHAKLTNATYSIFMHCRYQCHSTPIIASVKKLLADFQRNSYCVQAVQHA